MEKRTQQGKLTNLEIASFCSEMAMILKSGISSLEGIDLLREDAQTKAEKELLDEIYQSVMDTGRLDQALEETKVFPEYLIRMTQIGEETGTLDEVMESLAEHYDRDQEKCPECHLLPSSDDRDDAGDHYHFDDKGYAGI